MAQRTGASVRHHESYYGHLQALAGELVDAVDAWLGDLVDGGAPNAPLSSSIQLACHAAEARGLPREDSLLAIANALCGLLQLAPPDQRAAWMDRIRAHVDDTCEGLRLANQLSEAQTEGRA